MCFMVDVTLPKWDDGRLPGKHEVGRFRWFLTRTQPSFAQYSTDFRQTKTVVCVLARSSGNSNAREWWVSVRVFRGISV